MLRFLRPRPPSALDAAVTVALVATAAAAGLVAFVALDLRPRVLRYVKDRRKLDKEQADRLAALREQEESLLAEVGATMGLGPPGSQEAALAAARRAPPQRAPAARPRGEPGPLSRERAATLAAEGGDEPTPRMASREAWERGQSRAEREDGVSV